MLDKGITGLEKFTRIPGTLGGWVFINAHGHTHFLGDFIHEVRSITPDGQMVTRSWKDLDFGYDHSIFHQNGEVIVDATLRLFKGNADAARNIAVEVMKNKMLRQPSNSGGCVFHNVSKEVTEKFGFESDAVGYIVDKQLGWLGSHKVGGAWISEKHGNFIETDGTASAQDILAVMQVIKDECRRRYGIELQEEIFRVGEF
jgi:UDP-N-acetylmuramate dehydrogenase